MRLLTKTLLLSSLLLPTHLLAADMDQGSDYSGMDGMVNGYISFYGLYPQVQEYELSGAKATKLMDVVKLERDTGFGIGGAMGFWASSEMAVEVDFQYLNRVDKFSSVVTQNGKKTTDNDVKVKAGHIVKLETQAWKVAFLGKYYLSALMGTGGGENPWCCEGEEEGKSFVVAPYFEGGVSLAYDTKKIKDSITLGNTADDTGAKLSSADDTNLKKFDDSEFLFAWQVGGGVDFALGESVVSIGYRLDYGLKEAKFKQTINTVEYELSYDKLKTHNGLVSVKFAF